MNVFIISEKIGLVTLENVFDLEMKSIHHFREDWLRYSGERF